MTGEDGGEPSRVPVSLLDMGTGMWMAISALEALRRRDQTGVGCHVQNSLLQTALTWITSPLIGAAAGNPPPTRLGSGFRGVVPYGAFPTSDGHIFVSAGNNDIFHRLLGAIDSPDLAGREGFATNPDRVRNRRLVQDTLAERTSRFTLAALTARLAAAGVPHSPVNTVDMVYEDEQVRALGMLQALPHAHVADLEVVNLPATFDGQYVPLTKAPPALGEDTVEVLRALGRTDDEIDTLVGDGVVARAPSTPCPPPPSPPSPPSQPFSPEAPSARRTHHVAMTTKEQP
jgi:crotonobetainyl-CoA:carnitine CoA-transferase CaiB-like acyl-CoA transferase